MRFPFPFRPSASGRRTTPDVVPGQDLRPGQLAVAGLDWAYVDLLGVHYSGNLTQSSSLQISEVR